MSRRRDAFDELVSANPVDRDRLPAGLSPWAQHTLAAILDTMRDAGRPNTPRWKRRRLVVIAVVLLTLVALGATWILTRPVTQPQAIACFQAPNLDADRVAVQSGSSAAACEHLWADGTLSNPTFGPAGSVPPLVACVSEAGSLFVFPSDDLSLCGRLGLAEPDPSPPQDADRVRAIIDDLANYFSDQPCIPIQRAADDVRRILDEQGATDWTIDATPGTDDRPCASVALDAEQTTVLLVPIPPPPTP